MERLKAALSDRYRVERELGAGGMATVYLAHDLKHDREVAIKVLHQELAAALGAERFLTEIKTTARLQHPHILPLLDSGDANGVLFYVMPFVAGESLRDRLNREKQLPLEDAIRVAREVADALGYAHGHGIVHRDIKPENILLQGNHAAVADFGIALAVQSAGGSRLTQTGLSLGTPNYMSPEQAMGDKTIDARSDIYALGAVTYEMLTGEPPFTGANVQAIVAKVLSDRPRPPSMVRDTVPPEVDAAVLKCLAKLPADRFVDASSFATALTAPSRYATSGREGARAPGFADRARRWQAVSAALVVTSVSLGVMLFQRGSGATTAIGLTRAEVGIGLTSTLMAPTVAAAPDGRSIVYCNGTDIWMRRWEDLSGTRLRAGDGGCMKASFSPDGRSIAILGLPTSLRIVSLTGEAPPRTITVEGLPDIATVDGGLDWASDGFIYIASRAVLLRIRSEGGGTEVVARIDSANALHTLDVLPDAGASIVVVSPRGSSALPEHRVGILDHRTGTLDFVRQGIVAEFVSPDLLVVVRDDGSLVAVPFDVGSRRATGPPVPLADSVPVESPSFAVASNGALVYMRSGGSGLGHPVLVDRNGATQDLMPLWSGVFLVPRISPDGSRFAVEHIVGAASDTWMRDLRTGQTTRLTTTGSTTGRPTWTPDGRSLTIISDRTGSALAYERRFADGTTTPLAKYDPRGVFATEWSRDGKWLVLRTDDQAAGKGDILAVRPGVDSVAVPIAASSEYSEYSPSLSPDGKWLAYVSNESGRYDVWVTSFPVPQGKYQVSSAGGTEPLWSRNGRELFYIADRHLVVATVTTAPSFQASPPQRLFPIGPFREYGIFNRNYDVMPDDRRFLMIRRDEEPTARVVAVFNWRAQLDQVSR